MAEQRSVGMHVHRRGFLKGLAALGACPSCLGQAAAEEAHAPHWSYTGEYGPEDWDELGPEYKVCETGVYQSPVNITEAIVAELPPIETHWTSLDASVVNNGHTVQVVVPPGTQTTAGARQFELIQFHFHAPSEHLVAGRSMPMEAHFVHRDTAGTGLAVIGVFLVPGAGNPAFARLAAAFPATEGGRSALPALDIAALLPVRLPYWSYAGSLTTPPCSEVVDWLVVMDPLTVAAEDIAKFTALYPHDARPVKALDRRFILASEARSP